MSDLHPVEAEVRRRIARDGPLSVADYMQVCLAHPTHGYYISRDPFGRDGDFTTAPEISQMFGELIGLWAAATWELMGAPENVRLVELGPGRGTLMADALRAAAAAPAFRRAIAVHLVETSPALRARQHETLRGLDLPVLWHDTLDEVPGGPAIVIANEFFDALPVRQAIKQEHGWCERLVGIDHNGKLSFTVAETTMPHVERTLPPQVRDAAQGAIYEWRSERMMMDLSRRVIGEAGAALIIDYGHAKSGVGDTLQAVRHHRFADPLESPGLADVTAHVDFEELGRSAAAMEAKVYGPVEQATLLRRLGLELRASRLMAAAPDQAHEIETAYARLTAGGPTGMGTLFKAMGIAAPGMATLPGFG